MTPNWMGLVTAAATFFGIWMGHVGVRKIESVSPSLWTPALGALGLGAALEIGALLSTSPYFSGALGIVGMTFLWDALEFRRQHHRVRRGHAPANRRNPRHARLLAESPSASPRDWLRRDPIGRPVTPEEALVLLRSRGSST